MTSLHLEGTDFSASERQRLAGGVAAHSTSSCLLGTAGEILLVSRSWDEFARGNGGAPACLGAHVVGKNYFSFIEGLGPRNYYETVWAQVIGGTSVSVGSECNTVTVARRLLSHFLPVKLGHVYGAVVMHAVIRDVPIADVHPIREADAKRYLHDRGQLVACSSCRRVRSRDGSGWSFVPAYFDKSHATSFGYCRDCLRLLRYRGRPDSVPGRG